MSTHGYYLRLRCPICGCVGWHDIGCPADPYNP